MGEGLVKNTEWGVIMFASKLKRVKSLGFFGMVIGVFMVLLAGCASNAVNTAIQSYSSQASRIELGQSKEKVLGILLPTQAHLSASQSKSYEEFMQDGKKKEIYFFRSRSFRDGLVTDDEFTPYVFEDGVLVAIGWTAIGGPKTQAQTRDDYYNYHFHGRIHHY